MRQIQSDAGRSTGAGAPISLSGNTAQIWVSATINGASAAETACKASTAGLIAFASISTVKAELGLSAVTVDAPVLRLRAAANGPSHGQFRGHLDHNVIRHWAEA